VTPEDKRQDGVTNPMWSLCNICAIKTEDSSSSLIPKIIFQVQLEATCSAQHFFGAECMYYTEQESTNEAILSCKRGSTFNRNGFCFVFYHTNYLYLLFLKLHLSSVSRYFPILPDTFKL